MKNLLIGFIGTFFWISGAHADGVQENITISHPWVRAIPTSVTDTEAYMTITNDSSQEVVLVSADSVFAGTTEIRQMSDKNGSTPMATAGNVPVPVHGKVILQPNGFHIMLINLKKPLNKGDLVPIMLHFGDGTEVLVKAQVASRP